MKKGAIIGFGKIAQTNHLPAFNSPKLKSHAEIVAVVEPDQSNMEISKSKHPELRFYKTVDDMLRYEEIDFADITCPPKFHAEIMEKLIKNNLHIICEKPFTLDLQDAERIKDKLNSSGLMFLPCHQYKYSPIWKTFKNTVNKRAGTILQFDVFRMAADPGIEITENRWRTGSPKDGGGILLDTGIHYLYLLYWMLGEPNKITARLPRIRHTGYACEDSAFIILEYDKTIAQINITWAANKRYNDARLISENSSLFYEGRNKLQINNNGSEKELLVPDASDKQHYVSLYSEMFTEFILSVEEKRTNPYLIEEAYQSIRLINSCKKSSDSEKTVSDIV
ncbi:MAG: Gfo/Idh/MocA family oxidoreductase [Ignavibacteriaceae bacterium]|nr:Gfo/Idh/MocA family oxidoreductase [Ignavibacteriaceae bacterium]